MAYSSLIARRCGRECKQNPISLLLVRILVLVCKNTWLVGICWYSGLGTLAEPMIQKRGAETKYGT